MSIICTCGNSGDHKKNTGFACNFADGCPYNEIKPIADPIENTAAVNRIKDIRERVKEEILKPGQVTDCYPKCDPPCDSLTQVQDIIDKSIQKADELVRSAANLENSWQGVEKKVTAVLSEYEKIVSYKMPDKPKGWLSVLAIDKDTQQEVTAICDRRIILQLPNGDELRIRYDDTRQMVEISKMSDTANGAISMQPGASNQIFII